MVKYLSSGVETNLIKNVQRHPAAATTPTRPSSRCCRSKCRGRYIFITILTLSALSYLLLSQLMEKSPKFRSKYTRFKYDMSQLWPVINSDFKKPCHLPQLNPFDKTVMDFVWTPGSITCAYGDEHYPPIFESDLEAHGSVLVQILEPGQFGLQNCCYTPFIHKIGTKDEVTFSNFCTPITAQRTEIESSVEFIRIQCSKMEEKVTMVVVDMLGFFPVKSKNFEKVDDGGQQTRSKDAADFSKVNVVILSLDSISHMNFQRTMTQTHAYLTKNLSAFWMDGYTKVGESTFPALMPMFSGRSVSDLKNLCWSSPLNFDDCNPHFIWSNYSQKDYLTAFGEDATDISMFLWQKGGFFTPPTDYYLHPMMTQLDLQCGHRKLSMSNACNGPRLSFQVLLNFIKGMAVKGHQLEKNYFQTILATSLFHDGLNYGMLADEILTETLKWFQNGGYFNNTIFILMSDHGQRGGQIRMTLQGRIEDSMPFMYFVLPSWFQKKFQRAVTNLVTNRQRLVTTFDLHATFHDFLYLDQLDEKTLKEREVELDELSSKSSAILGGDSFDLDGWAEIRSWRRRVAQQKMVPQSISLFLPIPARRTCTEAGVSDNFCVCSQMAELAPEFKNKSIVLREAAQFVVQGMNDALKNFSDCAPLMLKTVNSAQILRAQNEEGDEMSADQILTMIEADGGGKHGNGIQNQGIAFFLAITVEPSGGTFESVVKRGVDVLKEWSLEGEIIRTNLYGNQSVCVHDYILKKFCFCQ